MAWKLKYRCKQCGYEAEVYEGRGLFRQEITAMSCPDCKTIQNIVVGGIIADVAPLTAVKSGVCAYNVAVTTSGCGISEPAPSVREKWNRLATKSSGRKLPFLLSSSFKLTF